MPGAVSNPDVLHCAISPHGEHHLSGPLEPIKSARLRITPITRDIGEKRPLKHRRELGCASACRR